MAIWPASSPSRADVISAIALASDGDTVTVPAGAATWTSPLHVNLKSITLQGAGIGLTVITDGTTKVFDAEFLTSALVFTMKDVGTTRLTGFTFNGGGSTPVDNNNNGIVQMRGVTQNMRVDHCHFLPTRTVGLKILGWIYGVIDHNTFSLVPGWWAIFNFNGANWDGTWGSQAIYGDGSWGAATELGTLKALFVEDNTFTATPDNGEGIRIAHDGWSGARVVYRFNTDAESWGFGTHGTMSPGRPRGYRQHEVYQNTHSRTGPVTHPASVSIGSGVALTFGNTSTGSGFTGFGNYAAQRQSTGSYAIWGQCGTFPVTSLTRVDSTATVQTSGMSIIITGTYWITIAGANQPEYNGTFRVLSDLGGGRYTYTITGTPATPATGTITLKSPWDGNTTSFGYPAFDSPGRGQGQLITDTTPGSGVPINSITGTAAWPNQALEPCYAWLNTLNGVTTGFTTASPNVIAENVEFYNEDITFTGTTGVGVGTRAQMDAITSATNGVAFWVTNEGSWNTTLPPNTSGRLYKRIGGVWTLFYEPYPYPHSLVDTPAPPSPPPTLTTGTSSRGVMRIRRRKRGQT